MGESKLVDGDSTYYVVPLHKKPKLIDECCKLINMEWPRSITLRKRSIEGSSEKFPMSLLLIKQNETSEVVGHCKISKLPFFKSDQVLVQSVVIHPGLRGKGLGRFLMQEVEKMVKNKNVKCIFLTTKGQEKFYSKLGYHECPSFGFNGSPSSNLDKQIHGTIKDKILSSFDSYPQPSPKLPPPPPPPPPLPLPTSHSNPFPNNTQVTLTYMKKDVIN